MVYTLITGKKESVEMQINAHFMSDWKLHGNITTTIVKEDYEEDWIHYAQAMVLKKSKK